MYMAFKYEDPREMACLALPSAVKWARSHSRASAVCDDAHPVVYASTMADDTSFISTMSANAETLFSNRLRLGIGKKCKAKDLEARAPESFDIGTRIVLSKSPRLSVSLMSPFWQYFPRTM